MTPYNYHAINSQNQIDRLRERDQIRLAAYVSNAEAQGPQTAGRFPFRRSVQAVYSLLTQAARP